METVHCKRIPKTVTSTDHETLIHLSKKDKHGGNQRETIQQKRTEPLTTLTRPMVSTLTPKPRPTRPHSPSEPIQGARGDRGLLQRPTASRRRACPGDAPRHGRAQHLRRRAGIGTGAGGTDVMRLEEEPMPLVRLDGGMAPQKTCCHLFESLTLRRNSSKESV